VVIGVAEDTRSERFGILDGPRLYTLRDSDSIQGELFIRFSGDATPIAKGIEQVVKTLDPSQVGAPSTVWDFLKTNATEMRALARISSSWQGLP
jgi:hypothetical protein